jgi:hypothetical protein
MKRKLMYLALAVFCAGIVVSCNKDNDGDNDDDNQTKVAKVKTISFDSPDWKESWEFVYDENGKTTKIYNTGEDWADTITFDYSSAGKVIITKESKAKTYLLNTQGLISERWENNTGSEKYVYEYDSDGYLVKSTEYWDGGNEVKFTATITNGNLTSIVYKPTNEGHEWTKTLTYASGENVAGIHQAIQQAEAVNDWQAQTGLFGKPNININTKVEKSTGSDNNLTY